MSIYFSDQSNFKMAKLKFIRFPNYKSLNIRDNMGHYKIKIFLKFLNGLLCAVIRYIYIYKERTKKISNNRQLYRENLKHYNFSIMHNVNIIVLCLCYKLKAIILYKTFPKKGP